MGLVGGDLDYFPPPIGILDRTEARDFISTGCASSKITEGKWGGVIWSLPLPRILLVLVWLIKFCWHR